MKVVGKSVNFLKMHFLRYSTGEFYMINFNRAVYQNVIFPSGDQNAWISEMEKIKDTHSLNSITNESESEAAKHYGSEWFDSMCDAVKIATNMTLPHKITMTPIQRQVSQHTKENCIQRRKGSNSKCYLHHRTKHTKQIFKDIPKKIHVKSWCVLMTIKW